MYKEVEQRFKICITCAQKKRPVIASKPPLLIIPVTGPWDVTATDCVGPLPISLTGNKYIIVISNLYTNFTEAFVVPTVQTSIAAQGFTDNIFFFHGAPQKF